MCDKIRVGKVSDLSEDIEREFRSRTVVPGPTLFLDPEAALEPIRRATESGVRIPGIDGFVISEGKTRPSMEHSVDYSHCRDGVAEAAVDFVRSNSLHVTHFEVVLD